MIDYKNPQALMAARQKAPHSHPPQVGHPDPDVVCPWCKVAAIYTGIRYQWITVCGPDPMATLDEHEIYPGGQKITDYQIQAPYAFWRCACGWVYSDGF
jgi:hypothetical protein